MKIQIEIHAQSKMHENILACQIRNTYAIRSIQQIVGWTLTAGTPIEPTSLKIHIYQIDVENDDDQPSE